MRGNSMVLYINIKLYIYIYSVIYIYTHCIYIYINKTVYIYTYLRSLYMGMGPNCFDPGGISVFTQGIFLYTP